MHLFQKWLVVLLMASALISCNKSEEQAALSEESSLPSSPTSIEAETQEEIVEAGDDRSPEEMLRSDILAGEAPAGRMLVLTAEARFEVEDVFDSAQKIEDLTRSLSGFVLRSNISTRVLETQRTSNSDRTILELSRYRKDGDLLLRLPVGKTQEFFQKLGGLMIFLDDREFKAEDVQFDILRQRLDREKAQETARKLDRVASQAGSSAKVDAIRVQNDAGKAANEAIVNEAVLEDKIAYSTVQLFFYEAEKLHRRALVDFDMVLRANRPGFFNRLGMAFVDGWEGFLDLMIDLAAFWMLLVLLGGGFFLYRLILYRLGLTRLKTETTAGEEKPKDES